MFTRFFIFITRIFPGFRTWIWKTLYNQFAGRINTPEWRFMNFGYAPDASENPKIKLLREDEIDRFGFRLYSHLLDQVNIDQNTHILEVGSGRGGACFFIQKYLTPSSTCGLDYSPNATQFCNANYKLPGLSYVTGNALTLPQEANSVDVVINIESSHAYPSFSAFVSEVTHVLKPGGHFLIADFRSATDVESFLTVLQATGLELISQKDISANVVNALKEDNAFKKQRINMHVPKWFQGYFYEFAGLEGTLTFENFKSGNKKYLSCVLKKLPS